MLLRDLLLEKLFSTPAGADPDLRNTPFFNILRANPSLSKFCAAFFPRHAANSSIPKALEIKSGFFLIQINPPKTIQPSHQRKARTQCQSPRTFASALTSRSTEPAAAPPHRAETPSAI